MIFLVNRSNGVAIYRAKYCTERFGRRSKIGRIGEVHHVGSGELRTTKKLANCAFKLGKTNEFRAVYTCALWLRILL